MTELSGERTRLANLIMSEWFARLDRRELSEPSARELGSFVLDGGLGGGSLRSERF